MKGLAETDIARAVILYISEFGWEVYQEVQPHRGGRCCDIVAIKGGLLWAIECKTSFGLSVLDQADHWTDAANLVSVATLDSKVRIAPRVAELLGVGWLTIEHGYETTRVEERAGAPLRRKVRPYLRACLVEEHKTFAVAGNAAGTRLTPFAKMRIDLLRRVIASPGIALRDLVAATQYHYATPTSARGSIAKWITSGDIPGIRIKRDGRIITLYPEKEF